MHFCFAATAVSMRIHFLFDSIFHGEELKVTAEMGEKEKRGVRSSLKLAKRGGGRALSFENSVVVVVVSENEI